MKKYIFIAALTFSAFIVHAQSLVAYFPFTGNTNDQSGYDNNASTTAVSLTNDRFNIANKAYSFTTSNSNIQVPDNPLFALTNTYSIAAWVKPAAVPANVGSGVGFTIASKDVGAGNNNPKWVFMLQNGALAFHINGPGLATGLWLYSNSFSVSANQWYHCAMSKCGNQVTFYVNGKNMGTSTLSSPSVNPASPLMFGYSEPGGNLNGSLDEIKVYSYAINDQEVGDEYANNSLVLSLPLNGNANDVSGLGNNGNIFGSLNIVADRFGNPNSALQFNGSASNFIAVPNAPSIQLSNQYSLAAWVKPSSFYTGSCQANFILAKGAQTSEGHYNLQYGDFLDANCGAYSPSVENFASTIKRGGSDQSVFENPLTQVVSLDKWYYVVCTCDGSVQRLYVNGKLRATNNVSGSFGTLNGESLLIGKSNDGSIYPVSGTLDDIKIYNVALPASQIFDTYVRDIKKPGSGTSILLTGTGLLNTCPYIQLGTGYDFGNQPFTYETWLKRDQIALTLNNFGKTLFVGDADNSWGIAMANDNTLLLTKVGVNAVFSTGTIADTFWHHVAVVYTGSQVQFYIDGILSGSPSYSESFNNNFGNYLIGPRLSFGNNNGDQTLDGKIDETRIWRNIALTQNQIRDWMCKKITSSHPAFANLFAYFRLDEGSGNLVGGYNGKYGNLVNTPTWKTSGAALGDDSKHDYVNSTKTAFLVQLCGEVFSATESSGSMTGLQLYRVDEQPNTLAGAVGVGGNNKYFGVFQVGGSSAQHIATYNYAGNPYVTSTNENELRLNKRNNNASNTWTMLSALPNEPANTITVGGANAEYILGKIGNPLQATLNLHLFLQAYYDGFAMLPVLMNEGVGNNSTVTDSIQVSLQKVDPPYSVVSTTKVELNTNGTASCNFPVVPGYYYVVINHRNVVQTWSARPVLVSSTTSTYNFTNSSAKAFGNNMIEVSPNVWAFYSGDINQDENVDLLDASLIEDDINNFQFGYLATDINGDGNVDLLDTPITETNITEFVFSSHP